MGIFKRMRKRRQERTVDTTPVEEKVEEPKRRRLFSFFSKERREERHAFRISVSGNRKWIMIGVAVVAICGTIIYLSVTYGGGFGSLLKLF